MLLAVSQANRAPGTELLQLPRDGTIAQDFSFEDAGNGCARFAAAHDLSEVIGNQLRKPQFLPFIRYRLEFVRSQMLLAVSQANRAPGTELLQLPRDGTIAQDFSFEDAGNGFVYIRSHVSNLYVTVRAPDVVTGGTTTTSATVALASGDATTSAGAHEAPPADSTSPGPGIVQDFKYAPTHVIAVGTKRPELQKWKLSPVGHTVLDRDLYVISNQAYPNLQLQPAEPSQPGSPTVLGDAGGSGGVHRVPPNTWRVTSPLISDVPVNTQ